MEKQDASTERRKGRNSVLDVIALSEAAPTYCGVIEHERRRSVDGRGAGIGGRVDLLASMQLEGLKFGLPVHEHSNVGEITIDYPARRRKHTDKSCWPVRTLLTRRVSY